jgi:hypothetical protein
MDYSETAQEISRHIRANALKYYPNLDRAETEVRLLGEQHRASSSIYRFEIVNNRVSYTIFAKGTALAHHSRHDAIANIDSRPRLAPGPTDFRVKTWLEYNALKVIYEHIERLGNPSFGAIRVLDFIQNSQTILMEEHSEPNLRSLFTKTNRLHHVLGKAPDLRGAFFNAGAWLNAYSALPIVENVITRLPGREDFTASFTYFTDFLGRVSGDTAYFQQIEKAVIRAANEKLPDNLPLGIGHGDYAMRNIMVGAGNRITVIDTCAKWRVPIYEDIAFFLVQLEINGIQVLTQGLAFNAEATSAYQREFLAGYFGQTNIPIDVLRLFEIQSLLDSWSAGISSKTRQHAGLKVSYPLESTVSGYYGTITK